MIVSGEVFRKMSKNSIYYNIVPIMSRNCLLNFVVGERGEGKTFGWRKMVIKNYIKQGSQFVYLRRNSADINASTKKFFTAKVCELFPEYDFKIKSNIAYIRPHREDDEDDTYPWETMGYFIDLSNSHHEKSASFDLVTEIAVDEFICKDDQRSNHYLPDEVGVFLEVYDTIARDRDVRVFFFGNSYSVWNPYFMYFNINFGAKGKIKVRGDIAVEITDNKAFQEHRKKTRFGQLIQGTDYERYAISNEFVQDNLDFVESKTGKLTYQGTLYYRDENFGVWYSPVNGMVYLSTDYQAECIYRVVIEPKKFVRGYLSLKSRAAKGIIDYIKRNLQDGFLRFDSEEAKAKLYQGLANIF